MFANNNGDPANRKLQITAAAFAAKLKTRNPCISVRRGSRLPMFRGIHNYLFP